MRSRRVVVAVAHLARGHLADRTRGRSHRVTPTTFAVLGFSGLLACGSAHIAADAGLDGSRLDASALDAGALDGRDASRDADASGRDADAGPPSFACDEIPVTELGRSPTMFAVADPALGADARGWLAAWALHEGVFVSRPGSPAVRVLDGASVALHTHDEGALVCAWSAAGDAGRCVTLDADLAVTLAPLDVDYGTALAFAHVGGALHAIEQILPTVSEPGSFALVPIDARGQRVGARTVLPCGSHQWFVPPAWTRDAIACVVDAGPSCDPALECPRWLRLVSPAGAPIAPDVPIPLVSPGPAPFAVQVGASGGAFLVSWIAPDGLHAMPVSATGVAGTPTRVGAVRGPADHTIVGIEAGYAVAYADARGGRDAELGVVLLSQDGHPISAPTHVSSGGMPAAGAGAGAGVGIAWLERVTGYVIEFRALGCTAPLGACPSALSQCTEAGSPVCVEPSTERCHCGACDVECENVCAFGECVPCPAGTVACAASACTAWGAPSDVTCAALDDDPAHCGSCARACATGEVCVEGACCAGREAACRTGGDLDCDGRVACADCDCWSGGACGLADPGDELDCTNGISEDFDGLVDCADPDCAAARPCGGAGRCPGRDLGTTFPLAELSLYSTVDHDLVGSCGSAAQAEVTVRWTAPSARRYTFVVGGPASSRPTLSLRDGTCAGAELACAVGEVSVDLAEGQTVIAAIEGAGAGCHELTIR